MPPLVLQEFNGAIMRRVRPVMQQMAAAAPMENFPREEQRARRMVIYEAMRPVMEQAKRGLRAHVETSGLGWPTCDAIALIEVLRTYPDSYPIENTWDTESSRAR